MTGSRSFREGIAAAATATMLATASGYSGDSTGDNQVSIPGIPDTPDPWRNAGLRMVTKAEMGGTGLEPVTSSLSNRPGRPEVAAVRVNQAESESRPNGLAAVAAASPFHDRSTLDVVRLLWR
jgi:hypothetical protein